MHPSHPLAPLCLLLLALASSWADRAAVSTVWPRTSNLQRYSGCNGFKIYGTCSALHRPEFLNSAVGSVLRIGSDQCLPLLAFVRCAIFKMACRNAVSNDLIFKVPCQASCEHAVGECRKYVHDDRAWDHLRAEDCRFLPSGGCLDWTVGQRRRSYLAGGLLSNAFCTAQRPPCNKMFPKRFKKRDFQQGNFSIVVDIDVKNVMWFFQGRHVHSYITAEVKRVFKSNIGLERGFQHTIRWPASCYCPGQILIGHRYYLLAHSLRRSHEFNVSVNAVFLPKLKRYRRKLQCWISTNRRCQRRHRRDRRRRRRRSLDHFRVWS